MQGLHDDSEVTLDEDVPDIEDERGADAQQAVSAAMGVTQDHVPYPESIGEGELLGQQERYPSEAVELRVDLVPEENTDKESMRQI